MGTRSDREYAEHNSTLLFTVCYRNVKFICFLLKRLDSFMKLELLSIFEITYIVARILQLANLCIKKYSSPSDYFAMKAPNQMVIKHDE